MPATSLPFQNLWERHPGITFAIGTAYAEAARVCLERHHSSPIEIAIVERESQSLIAASWPQTDERIRRSWANEIDATEWGACAIALAAVELLEGMVAVRRAETRTGADYFIAPRDMPVEDLESCYRLEISGVDNGDELSIRQRLNQKIRQALDGKSDLPAIATVVGFRIKLVVIKRAEES